MQNTDFNYVYPDRFGSIQIEVAQKQIVDAIWSEFAAILKECFYVKTENQNIVQISFMDNKIEKLPVKLCDLIKKLLFLEDLNINNNNLSDLPIQFAEMTHLKKLDLSFNVFIDLPPSVCQLPNLRDLDLHNNDLVTLPDAIGDLQQLRELNLSNNMRFHRLPPGFERLHLESLELWEVDTIHIEPATHEMFHCMRDNGLHIIPNDWDRGFHEFHAIWDNPDTRIAFLDHLKRNVEGKVTLAERNQWNFALEMPNYEEIADWLEPLCKARNTSRANEILGAMNKQLARKHMPVPSSEHQILL